MKVAYVDFETAGIEARPDYPPIPAGVAIRKPGQKKSRYYAWGHPTGNNCTKEEAVEALAEVWGGNWAVSFHNAKFDLDVAETHLGLAMIPWGRVHDTMILAFLVDPHAKKIGLKELAEARLGLPSVERDGVREWLIAHGIEKSNSKQWGRSIAKAPGDLVGKYACGDTDRTKLLFEDLYKEVEAADMLGAYDRERQLISILLENERQGICVDSRKLKKDVGTYISTLIEVDERLYTLLSARFNIDSDEELANVLDAKYPGIDWPLTPTGRRSTAKAALEEVLSDMPPELYALTSYRATVNTCLRTFMQPWLATAERTGGRIHTQWNSVAQSEGGGTRTGRLSSTPNFQNIPSEKSPNFSKAIELWEKHLKVVGIPPLPTVRSYIVADSKDEVLLDRDFSQQELRVLAHFEDGAMLGAYLETPTMDVHSMAAELMFGEATPANRKITKNLSFGILYGMGLGALAERLKVSVDEAKRIKQHYLNTFPGIAEIQKALKFRGRQRLPMVTWGGRKYLSEPAKVVDGRLREFEYKLFNYLIQGSSADITKEAMIRYATLKKHGRLLFSVHDQIIVSCPKKYWKEEMALLKEAMEGVPLDAPLLSDGAYGYRWTETKECE